MPINTQDLKIPNITFNKFEEYVSSILNYDDYSKSIPSYYRYYPESESFSYGCLSHSNEKLSEENKNDLLITSPFMTGSDYSGTTVELSNYEVFKEEFKELLGTAIFDVYGGYSTFSIAISVRWLLNPENEEKAQEIIEVLNALSDYPLIDEEHLSEMESKKEYEWITDKWGFGDCEDEFKKQYGIELIDVTEDQKWGLYRELSERANQYPLFEDNGVPYIYWKKIVESYKIGDLTRLNIAHELIDQ